MTLRVIIIILVLRGTAFCEEPPKPTEKIPEPTTAAAVVGSTAPEKKKEELTEDEVRYVRDLFHNAVVDTACALAVVPEMSKSGEAVVNIRHPSESPVVKFLQTKLFKDAHDMESQIFGIVYAAAANSGQHTLNTQGERNFLRSKMQEKIRTDTAFFDALVIVVKEAIK